MEQQQARQLPIFNMAGTDFYVDIRLNAFREVNAPWNAISFDEIVDHDNTSALAFDTRTHNVYTGIIDPDHIPDEVVLVIVPPLAELDPAGMIRKLGLREQTTTDEHQLKKGRKI
ncbi:MAG: hypothetical protein JST19_06685 [Bacteroidetes bacterium]|nr:hypothetical protein [Bacteroidota bacterium]